PHLVRFYDICLHLVANSDIYKPLPGNFTLYSDKSAADLAQSTTYLSQSAVNLPQFTTHLLQSTIDLSQSTTYLFQSTVDLSQSTANGSPFAVTVITKTGVSNQKYSTEQSPWQ
ncbi:MAG: hypothetical protein LBP76_01820, partial [Treponema sp.]|nr:hypothetical protein [Treponema sp.]